MAEPQAGDAYFRRIDDFPCTVVGVAGGGVTLKTSAGGTDTCPLDALDRLYRRDPVTRQYKHARGLIALGQRWVRRASGEAFTVEKIDPPPFDRVVLRGGKGQGVGVGPISELFTDYEQK